MNRARLGLRENAAQLALLVGLNVIVGALVGLERSVLPVLGEREFGLTSKTAILSFLIGFGAAKALANLAAGGLAGRYGRRPVLIAGWVCALPAALLVGLAPSWSYVVAANVFLGASQGLAWSMTVLMKLDLAGPRNRGLAVGLNESAGYVGCATTALASGVVAATVAPRTVIWVGAALLTLAGLAASMFVHETHAHAKLEQEYSRGSRDTRGSGFPAHQAGFVNNLNDALAWGLVPLYLAANGASPGQIGVVAGVYPALWGVGQLAAGTLSDRVGRRPLIVLGMLVQGAALSVLVIVGGSFRGAVVAAALLGAGTALAYPTLLALVSDGAEPRRRANALARYRFWRDTGLVAGAVFVGVGADSFGVESAIVVVAVVTTVSGLVVAWAKPRLHAHPVGAGAIPSSTRR